VVTGINPQDPPVARQARMAVYQRLLAELDSSGQKLSAQISEIDLTDPDDARVLMPEQGTDILAHFGEDHFLERYQRYKAHIAEWRQQYPNLAAVDLRYDQQVVLQMAPDTNTAQASADEQPAASAEQDKPAKPAKITPDKPATAGKKAGAKPVLAAHAEAGKAAAKTADKSLSAKAKVAADKSSTAGKVKPAKASGKADGKVSAKVKTASKAASGASLKTAKNKTEDKKRAAVKRASLNGSKQKRTASAGSARMGQ
jgi:cell division protein FtsQ